MEFFEAFRVACASTFQCRHCENVLTHVTKNMVHQAPLKRLIASRMIILKLDSHAINSPLKLELSIVNFLFVSKQLYCSWNFLFGSHFHWNSSNNINLLCWLLQFDLPFISLGFVFVGGIHKSFFQRFLKCEAKSLYYQRNSDSPSILWNFNYPNEAEVFQPNSKSGTVSAEGVSFTLFFMPPPEKICSRSEIKTVLFHRLRVGLQATFGCYVGCEIQMTKSSRKKKTKPKVDKLTKLLHAPTKQVFIERFWGRGAKRSNSHFRHIHHRASATSHSGFARFPFALSSATHNQN